MFQVSLAMLWTSIGLTFNYFSGSRRLIMHSASMLFEFRENDFLRFGNAFWLPLSELLLNTVCHSHTRILGERESLKQFIIQFLLIYLFYPLYFNCSILQMSISLFYNFFWVLLTIFDITVCLELQNYLKIFGDYMDF